jgi:outer membrane protein assembly factor BamB
MPLNFPLLLLAGCTLGSLISPAFGDDRRPTLQEQWGQWRGPLGTGVAPQANPPIHWNEADGINIRWKTPLPGLGHSTPIVWGDRIFLTTAIPHGTALEPRYSRAPNAHDNLPVTHRQKFVALAIDRTTGKIVWQKVLRDEIPHEGHHQTGSLASNSAATDGERVFFFFGSFGLYCLDFAGHELWRADLGKMQPLHGHGEGSSPALSGDTLVVNWDHEGESFVVAFNAKTGTEKWRVPRDETTSWSSPLMIEHEGVPQVVVSATHRIRGYDLQTGKVLWSCGGLSTNVVASPVYASGMLFTGSSYDTRSLLAIRLEGATGDLTGSRHIAWKKNRATPYVPSPLLYRDSLYYLNHYQGVLTRVSASTGEDCPGAFRLAGIDDVYSSPVAAADRIYVTDRKGTTLVINNTEKHQVLAENHLEETVSASAAIVGREILLRGDHSLYSLAETDRAP